MSNCKVEFITAYGQKIVVDCFVDEQGYVHHTISFEPKITDPKLDLGLAGELCKTFVETIFDTEKDEITNDTTKN